MAKSMNMKILASAIVIVVIVFSLWFASSQWLAGTNPKEPSLTATPTPAATQSPTANPSPTSTIVGTVTPAPSGTTYQTNTPSPTQSPTSTPTTSSTPTQPPNPTPTQSPIAQSGTVAIFNFDDSATNIYLRQPTPVNLTSSLVTAQFISATAPATAFSIQSQGTTFFILSKTSGNYLEHSYAGRNALNIVFSQPIKSITLNFATIDYHDPAAGNPTPVQLTAYSNSTKTTTVGNPVTMSGSFITGDSYPQGTITFSSSTPFSAVEFQVPFIAQGAVDYIIDNITVTVA